MTIYLLELTAYGIVGFVLGLSWEYVKKRRRAAQAREAQKQMLLPYGPAPQEHQPQHALMGH